MSRLAAPRMPGPANPTGQGVVENRHNHARISIVVIVNQTIQGSQISVRLSEVGHAV